MAQAVTVDIEDGLGVVRIERAHGNAINDEVVDGLITACQELDADPAVRGMLLGAKGKLFCPGLDLRELVEYDRPAMKRFIDRFNACILVLYTFAKPMVAALHGHAVAGGCVVSLTADWRVLRRGAQVGLNEVRVGVPFPFGVSMVMRETIPREHLEEVALFGWNYTDERAIEVGLAHELHDEEGFEEHCRSRLTELGERDPDAFAITKRYLRSATVERIRAHDALFAREFLDSWFTDATRARMRKLVEGLK